jgi:hypothetical protein
MFHQSCQSTHNASTVSLLLVVIHEEKRSPSDLKNEAPLFKWLETPPQDFTRALR